MTSYMCPQIGFLNFSDVFWIGQPTLNRGITVTADLHNLSPANGEYCSQGGEVTFRWLAFSLLNQGIPYSSLPLLAYVPGGQNPVRATDPNNGNTAIAPQTYLPATMQWVPDTATVGSGPNPKGFIVCQATADGNGICPTVNPPNDSSPMQDAYDIISAKVSVSSTAVSEPPMMAARAGTGSSALHFGFVIANPLGVDVTMKVSLKVLGAQPTSLKFELGAHRAPLVLGIPSPIGPDLYDGPIPRRMFAELVARDAPSSSEFPMEAFSFRQGLLEVSVPPGFDPAASIARIDYAIIPAGSHESIPFRGFALPLGDFSVNLKEPVRKDSADGKK